MLKDTRTRSLSDLVVGLIKSHGDEKVGKQLQKELRKVECLIGRQRYLKLVMIRRRRKKDAGRAVGDARDATIVVLVDFLIAGYGGNRTGAITRAIKEGGILVDQI